MKDLKLNVLVMMVLMLFMVLPTMANTITFIGNVKDDFAQSTLTLNPSSDKNTVDITAENMSTSVILKAIVVNEDPVANDDSVTTHMGNAVDFNILANDYDPDGDSLTVTNHVEPIHGTLTCNDNGQCEYTPDEGFVGADSFKYEISDGLLSATATVFIYVTNSPPVAVDDFVTTTMGTFVDFNILANDMDPDVDPLTIIYVGFPTHGTLVWNEDGQCEYTPHPGFFGTDSFQYEVSDGPSSMMATVTITVIDSSSLVELIEEILDFANDSIESGTLAGVGPGKSAEKRLNAFINMLKEARKLTEDGLYEEARDQLWAAYKKCDGQSKPPDFVTGEAVENLATMIMEVIEELESE